MSKRSRRRYNNQPRQIVAERRDLEHEHQIMSASVEDVAYHHPIVKQLMDRLPNATATEAVNIGLVLQQILRGDASILSNPDDPGARAAKEKLLREAEARDRAAEAFDKDAQGFAEEVFRQADKIRPVGDQLDRTIAQGMDRAQYAREMAVAKKAHRQLRLQEILKNGPRETINVIGETETFMQNGVQGRREIPVIINVMGARFVLPTGTHTVPHIVAERYREIERSRAEIIERQKVLSLNTNKSYNEVEMANKLIDDKYGTSAQHLPLVGDM